MENKTTEIQVKEVWQKCIDGEINPIDAAKSIDSVIGGITRVEFKNGLKFKIDNHSKKFALGYSGRNKQIKRIYELAVASYYQAKQKGEVCIDKGLSTKHYMGGIRDMYNKMLMFYAGAAA